MDADEPKKIQDVTTNQGNEESSVEEVMNLYNEIKDTIKMTEFNSVEATIEYFELLIEMHKRFTSEGSFPMSPFYRKTEDVFIVGEDKKLTLDEIPVFDMEALENTYDKLLQYYKGKAK